MTDLPALLIINGPNLNMLGKREPSIYGTATLADIENLCRDAAETHGFASRFMQSNSEHEIIDAIHQAITGNVAAILINAGAFTHTSVAIRDALAMVSGPVIEIHLSNVHARESFRHHSYIAGVASGVIAGFGPASYTLAVDAAASLLSRE
ncbi:type II 3-dehydroquinate dehydratase [Alphaproteobacteria bacterium LSUCC0684]